MLIYTINEISRSIDLLANKLLSLPLRIKIIDRAIPDAPRKRDRLRKLIINDEVLDNLRNRTNSELYIESNKEAKEDILAPPRKRGRLRKYPLAAKDLIKKIIETRRIGVDKTPDILDYLAAIKLSIVVAPIIGNTYEASIGVDKTPDIRIDGAEVIKTPDINRILTRLKDAGNNNQAVRDYKEAGNDS